jgi:hypothetical protein
MEKKQLSSDELYQFKALPKKKIVDSMELYLIGYGQYRYNMEEVGVRLFGDANYSHTVSLIHRAYNFSGQNGGRYRKGCRFETTYGYEVTKNDIVDFVNQYPNGTYRMDITFEDFLITKVKSLGTNRSVGNQRKSAQAVRHNDFDDHSSVQHRNVKKQGPVIDSENRTGDMDSTGKVIASIIVFVLVIFGIIVAYRFIRDNWETIVGYIIFALIIYAIIRAWKSKR